MEALGDALIQVRRPRDVSDHGRGVEPDRLRRPERRHFAVIGSSCSEDLAPPAVFHQITGALKKIEAAAACSAAREM